MESGSLPRSPARFLDFAPTTSSLKPSMPTTHLPHHLGIFTLIGARLEAVSEAAAGEAEGKVQQVGDMGEARVRQARWTD